MTPRKTEKAVREPVQVYMDGADRALLEQAATVSGLSRAEVLRRGLHRFAAELLADASPALAFLDSAAAASDLGAPADVATRHDAYLADWESETWKAASPRKATRKKR